MIKQSFLRNYNLSKISAQAEDQKKKLQVFYFRQVEKIIKQRKEMDRELSRQMTCKQHREQRLRLKQKIKEMKENRFSEDKQGLRRTKICRKHTEKDEPSEVQQKKKTDLFVSDLSLKSCLNSEDSKHQSLKITTVPNRTFHKKMLQSIMSKLKEQNGFQIEQDSKHQNLINKLRKTKIKTNPSLYDSMQNFNFYQQRQVKNKKNPIRALNKIRIKRTQTSKVLLKRGHEQNEMSVNVLRHPKFNMKFINQLESKGILKKQNQGNAQ